MKKVNMVNTVLIKINLKDFKMEKSMGLKVKLISNR